MKQERVLERVYNMGRLHHAWQQVRKNAGATGVDKLSGLITLDSFTERNLKINFDH